MKLRPLYDRVIIRRSEDETTTASGIVLPGNAAEKQRRGEILAVGAIGHQGADLDTVHAHLIAGNRDPGANLRKEQIVLCIIVRRDEIISVHIRQQTGEPKLAAVKVTRIRIGEIDKPTRRQTHTDIRLIFLDDDRALQSV